MSNPERPRCCCCCSRETDRRARWGRVAQTCWQNPYVAHDVSLFVVHIVVSPHFIQLICETQGRPGPGPDWKDSGWLPDDGLGSGCDALLEGSPTIAIGAIGASQCDHASLILFPCRSSSTDDTRGCLGARGLQVSSIPSTPTLLSDLRSASQPCAVEAKRPLQMRRKRISSLVLVFLSCRPRVVRDLSRKRFGDFIEHLFFAMQWVQIDGVQRFLPKVLDSKPWSYYLVGSRMIPEWDDP